jgi:2-oxoglutarate dehydrogenase E1 component
MARKRCTSVTNKIQSSVQKHGGISSQISKGGSSNGAASNGAGNQTVNQRGVPPIPKAQQAASQGAQPVQQPVATPSAPSTPAPTASDIALSSAKPAYPVVKPIPTFVSPGAATVEPLRGVSARVVQSMEASLTVPTATSVRAVPAKLMIDNRTVINNHLKRGRGGKVSFTHLIGYAMIKAARAMPEMNSFLLNKMASQRLVIQNTST